MKTPTTLGLVAATLVGTGALVGFTSPRAVTTAGESATFDVDPVHSSVVFRINHLGVAPFYGRFNEMEGSFDLADGGSVSVTVMAESVDTNNENRDNHLRNPDFFNAKQFPEITFESTSVKSTGDDTYEVEGELTMLGTTKPVTATFTKIGEGERGRFGYRAGIETEVTIKRSDYGMTFYLDNGALGDEVKLLIALEGTRN